MEHSLNALFLVSKAKYKNTKYVLEQHIVFNLLVLNFKQIKSFLMFHIKSISFPLCLTSYTESVMLVLAIATLLHVWFMSIYLFRRGAVLSLLSLRYSHSKITVVSWTKEKTIYLCISIINCRGGNRCCRKDLKLFLLFCLLHTDNVWDFLSFCLWLQNTAVNMFLLLYKM